MQAVEKHEPKSRASDRLELALPMSDVVATKRKRANNKITAEDHRWNVERSSTAK